MSNNGLTEAQNVVLKMTTRFVGKLYCNGVSQENALYEGYKFCEAALAGDMDTCTRMDVGAAIIGQAALQIGIRPEQVRAKMEQRG